MPFASILPAIIGAAGTVGASAVGGALANRKGARTSTIDQTTRVIGDPAFAGLKGALISATQDRLSAPTALPEGFEERGISDINETFRLVGQGLENRLSSRGLGRSSIAGNAATQLQLRRGGEISRFRTGLPTLERQLRDQDFANALRLFALRTQGRETSGTSVGPGSPAAGAFGSVGSMLGFLLGTGAIKLPGLGGSETLRV